MGKIGPYRPCSSSKKPSFGIALAAGFVQSCCMSAFLPFWSRSFARCCLIPASSIGTAHGRVSSCEAGDKATNDHIRDDGQDRCREKQLQGVNAGMHADLVDLVQDERDDENVPHIVPRLSQQL